VTRVIVSGICGRMGTIVARTVAASDDLSLVGGVETPGHAGVGRRLCEIWDDGSVEARVRGNLEEFDDAGFDVLIDFSTPAQAVACAARTAAARKGLVIGTTALADEQLAAVRQASASCPIVLAPNTSVGVNVLFGLAARVAEALGDGFDVEIVEEHHRGKKDAPSGTAVKLADIIARARGLDPAQALRAGRSGLGTQRGSGEIGVHSIRAGAIVGRHSVRFVSDLESVTIEHEAFSRAAFARGAIAAARFVMDREPGLYDLMDVLGFTRD
jgi:4-hydroxy-tetrahydrodipicolinate reductase